MKHLYTVILTICSFSLWAQDTFEIKSSNRFQLDIGMIQIKEENLHPKVHKGLLYVLQYEHARQKRNISTFTITLGYSRLKTKYEDLSATANIQLSGNYSYLFEAVKGKDLKYTIGPALLLYYNLSYYPNWDDSHLYWGNSLDLGIKNNLHYRINDKQSLVVDLELSLFSVFSRPGLNRQYKIDDISFSGVIKNLHSNLEGGTINKSLLFCLQAEYQFHISNKTTQAICYSYDYRRFKSSVGLPFQNSLHKTGLKIYF